MHYLLLAVTSVTMFLYKNHFGNLGKTDNSSPYCAQSISMLPPDNDDCSNATPIIFTSGLASILSSTIEATSSTIPQSQCSTGPESDVWLSFVAPDEMMSIFLDGYPGDGELELFSGTCNSLISLECANTAAAGNTESIITSSLIIGQTYYLRVFEQNALPEYQFYLNLGTPPANDECLNAQEIIPSSMTYCEVSTQGTTQYATGPGNTGHCGGADDDDVWYYFIATEVQHTVTIWLTNCNTTIIELLNGPSCPHAFMNCALVESPGCEYGRNDLYLNDLLIGQPYYLRIYSESLNDYGTFDLCVYSTEPILNDDCTAATPIIFSESPSCEAGTTIGATQSTIQESICSVNPEYDSWYSFVASSSNPILILESYDGNGILELFSGTCGSLVGVACANTNSQNENETIHASGLITGNTYYLRVYEENSVPFHFAVCIYAELVNDDCTNASSLTVNQDNSCTNSIFEHIPSAASSIVTNSLCSTAPQNDVWYSFEALQSSHVVFNYGVEGDLAMEVFSNTCGNLVSLGCSDAGGVNQNETLHLENLIIGNTYLVRIYEVNGMPLWFNLCITTPPTNDECINAIEIITTNGVTCQNPTIGTTFLASDSNLPTSACEGTPDDDVWYKFIATATLHAITLRYNGEQAVIELFSANCSSNALACSTTAPGYPTNVLTYGEFIIGQLYFIRIYTTTSSPVQSTFEICISMPPENDLCENALSLQINSDTLCMVVNTGTTVGATGAAYFGCNGNRDDDVWYTFTATQKGISLYLSETNGQDIGMELTDIDCNLMSSLACDDNSFRLSKAGLTIGEEYLIRINNSMQNGSVNSQGSFEVCAILPPFNDECENAVPVQVNADNTCMNVTHGYTHGATPSLDGILSGVCFPEAYDVWYSFVATANSHRIQITGSSNILRGQLFSSSCPGDPITNSLGCFTGMKYFLGLTAGETYYLRIFNNVLGAAADVKFDICITQFIANDLCAAPTTLIPAPGPSCNSSTSGTLVNATPSGYSLICGNSALPDVWYMFTATATTHAIHVTPTASGFDPAIGLYLRSTSGGTDDTGCTSTARECVNMTHVEGQPEVLVASSLTIGTNYLIQVGCSGNDCGGGTFDICITSPGIAMQVHSTSYETYLPATPAIPGRWRQGIKKITLQMSGTSSPLAVTNFDFHTTGTTDTDDLLSAQTFYAGSTGGSIQGTYSSFFPVQNPGDAAPLVFGTEISNPSGSMVFNGNQSIIGQSFPPVSNAQNYKRYFYLIYTLDCDADSTHEVNAILDTITIGGTAYVPFEDVQNNAKEIDVFQTYDTKNSGTWDNANTWVCGVPPQGPDMNDINIYHSVNISNDVQTGSIEVAYGGSLTLMNSKTLTLGLSSAGGMNGHSNKVLWCPQGSLNIDSDATLNVNGSLFVGDYISGVGQVGHLSLTSGTINIDGNDGTPSGSGSSRFVLGTTSATITDGTINILDPTYDGSAPEFEYTARSNTDAYIDAILTLGGGDDPAVSETGFQIGCIGEGTGSGFSALTIKEIKVNGGLYSSQRYVESYNTFIACRNLRVEANAEIIGGLRITENIYNEGVITSSRFLLNGGITMCGNVSWNNFGTNSAWPQLITGSGFFRTNISQPYPFIQYQNSISSLTIANTHAGGVTLDLPLQVEDMLRLRNGKINTSFANQLTLGNSQFGGKLVTNPSNMGLSTTEFTGDINTWDGGFVNGWLNRYMQGPVSIAKSIMPVGSGTQNKPVSVSYPSAGLAIVNAQYFQTDPGNTCVPIIDEQTIDITNISPTGYWRINPEFAPEPFSVSVNAGAFQKRGGGSITDLSNIRLVKRPLGGEWSNSNSSSMTGPGALTKVTAAGIMGNGYYGIGGGENAAGPDVMPLTHIVTSANEIGPGSLRDALSMAGCNDTIRFATSLNNDTIVVTTTTFLIDKNIFILGGVDQNISLQMTGTEIFFDVMQYSRVWLHDLALIADNDFDGYIISNNGALEIKNLTTSTGGGNSMHVQILNHAGGTIQFDGINLLLPH